MQTREEVTDGGLGRYASRPIPARAFRAYPSTVRVAIAAAAWLIPGAGHLALGRYWRGLLFFFVIGGCFFFGLGLHGRLYWPAVAEPGSAFHWDLISILWSFAQIGTGLCYLISYVVGLGLTPHPEAATYEYGNTFMFLAGLLNYLVIHDAFDIAAGRKR